MGKQAFNKTKNIVQKAMVRPSAGYLKIGREAQDMAFIAGADSIFTGDELLTTPNPGINEDHRLMAALGLKTLAPDKKCDEGCRCEKLHA
jgi:biotin synthase